MGLSKDWKEFLELLNFRGIDLVQDNESDNHKHDR